MIHNKNAISPNVVMRYPAIGKTTGYRKRENKTQRTLFHSSPFHRFIIPRSHFFLRMLVTIRRIESVPKISADQKGRNPGPGEWKAPTSIRTDSMQTNIEMPSQKRPANRSRRSIMSYSPEQGLRRYCILSGDGTECFHISSPAMHSLSHNALFLYVKAHFL